MNKLKSITKKLLIFFLALTFLTISPSETAEAKNIEMTKYVKKTAEQVAKMLKLKQVESDDPVELETLYTVNGKHNVIPVAVGVVPSFENKKSCWTIYLGKKDLGITVYGLKPTTPRKKAHKVLTKNGWKCANGSKWTDTVVKYETSKEQYITINYKNSKKNAKIDRIDYSPSTPEMFLG